MTPTVDDEEVTARRVVAMLAAVALVRALVWLGVGWGLLAGYNALATWTQQRARS